MSKPFKIILGIIGVIISYGVVAGLINGETSPNPIKTQDIQEDKAFFSGWDGSNRELVSLVKSSMHDPSSFEHVETRYHDNGNSYSILMKFRGNNAFGAKVMQQVTADIDKQTRKISNLKQTS